MKFPRFDMERMQSTWEHKVKYDLSESGVEALTLDEITRDPKELLKTRLGYAEGVGREATRTLIAGIHPGHEADDVMITTGTSEANFLTLASLVSPGDEVVVVMPNYMQVHGVATALGARVREVWLREERAWTIDLDALAAAVNARTKVICVCQPNNPTGQILSQAEVQSVVRIADREGVWILSDEVYRGAERRSFPSPPLHAAGRGRDLLLQLPVPGRLNGTRRSAHPRVRHDDRARHPVPRGAASPDRIRNDRAGAAFGSLRDRSVADDHRLTSARRLHDRRALLRAGGHMPALTISFILALIALVCGILMLVSGRWSRYPLAAIAVICLALNQTGLIHQ